jgi:hypothetical protein
MAAAAKAATIATAAAYAAAPIATAAGERSGPVQLSFQPQLLAVRYLLDDVS